MSHAKRQIGLVLLLTFLGGEAGVITLSNVRASSVSTQGAIIRWSTDEATCGRVNFGPSPVYGRTMNETEPTLDHYVFLYDLILGHHVSFPSPGQRHGRGAHATFTTAAKIEDLWPVVSLSFDDGQHQPRRDRVPFCDASARYARRGDVITDRLANPGKANMTLDHLLFLLKQGWAVDSHSRAHNRDTTLTDEDEIIGSITYLETHGINKVRSYRVPGSNHNAKREALAARTYPLRWGNVKGAPPSPRYANTAARAGHVCRRSVGFPEYFLGRGTGGQIQNGHRRDAVASFACPLHFSRHRGSHPRGLLLFPRRIRGAIGLSPSQEHQSYPRRRTAPSKAIIGWRSLIYGTQSTSRWFQPSPSLTRTIARLAFWREPQSARY